MSFRGKTRPSHQRDRAGVVYGREWHEQATADLGERSRPDRGPHLAAIPADAITKAWAHALDSGNNRLPATGHCHTCDVPISGERRYCGPCAADRDRARWAS